MQRDVAVVECVVFDERSLNEIVQVGVALLSALAWITVNLKGGVAISFGLLDRFASLERGRKVRLIVRQLIIGIRRGRSGSGQLPLVLARTSLISGHVATPEAAERRQTIRLFARRHSCGQLLQQVPLIATRLLLSARSAGAARNFTGLFRFRRFGHRRLTGFQRFAGRVSDRLILLLDLLAVAELGIRMRIVQLETRLASGRLDGRLGLLVRATLRRPLLLTGVLSFHLMFSFAG